MTLPATPLSDADLARLREEAVKVKMTAPGQKYPPGVVLEVGFIISRLPALLARLDAAERARRSGGA